MKITKKYLIFLTVSQVIGCHDECTCLFLRSTQDRVEMLPCTDFHSVKIYLLTGGKVDEIHDISA